MVAIGVMLSYFINCKPILSSAVIWQETKLLLLFSRHFTTQSRRSEGLAYSLRIPTRARRHHGHRTPLRA